MADQGRDDLLDSIAVVGMAGRFPGAPNIESFWRNLCAGRESITFFSDQELLDNGVAPDVIADPDYVKAGGTLDGIEMFDAEFFGFTPREAEITDPQHRVFLECAWEALENAALNPDLFDGRIAVYAGAGLSTYLLQNLFGNPALGGSVSDLQCLIGNSKDYMPTRTSYRLNLKGPSVNVSTACSTSLVAVHTACQSLLDFQSDAALAGGVGIQVPQRRGYLYQENGIVSPDGHCRAFDADAKGTVNGNGVGIVVLKRLEQALADGDRIRAVIKGSAINNDGAAKVGFTAPSIDGQAAVIAEAQAAAGLSADSISYLEAHGTGTEVGDPIEVAALNRCFGPARDDLRPCALGSVKTNVGHLDEAAGIAGLIKTVLALEHRKLPPSLHFETPNPAIDFESSRFRVNSRLCDWSGGGAPLRAGVSSFGIGGTNAHVVLEEAPPPVPGDPPRPWQLLVLSARSEAALESVTRRLTEFLEANPEVDIADLAFSLQVGRKAFDHRRAVLCRDPADALRALRSNDPSRVFSGRYDGANRSVAFLFPGQGNQYVDMGLGLYRAEPAFRARFDRCAELLRPHLGLDLRACLFPADGDRTAATERLTQTAIAQPALFVIEYALARLLIDWGLAPRAMIGHSIGEYVAACLAGVLDLEDALDLVAARGALMQALPSGAMLAVFLSTDQLAPRLGADLDLAAVNGSALCVVSGPTAAVAALERELEVDQIGCKRLQTSHAFHSAMMAPVQERYAKRVAEVALKPPKIPFVSNVTGTWITDREATDPHYWARHLRQTVRFADGAACLLAEPGAILLEVGPGRSLVTACQNLNRGETAAALVTSIRRPQESLADLGVLHAALGKLWLAGAPVDWVAFHADERRCRMPLPSYPFERQRYWVDPPEPAADVQPCPADGPTRDLADWFYRPIWTRAAPLPDLDLDPSIREGWLVFLDETGLGAELAAALKRLGQDVATVTEGPRFSEQKAGSFTLDPGKADHYHSLLQRLAALGPLPRHVLHLWCLPPMDTHKADRVVARRNEHNGFYSLLFLTQALGGRTTGEPVEIIVVSSQLQEVTGGEQLCPEKALLLGPLRVIPQEYPDLQCRSIDIDPPGDGDQGSMSEPLLREILAGPGQAVVAYRDATRWQQDLQPLRLGAPSATRLREGGVYLITGGLGSMGLAFAGFLAETSRAKLVLVGRQAPDLTGRTAQLDALERQGAEVMVLQADVSDSAQMKQAFEQADERFGALHGVIHTAGVLGQGPIHTKTEEEVAQVFAAKVEGTRVLDALLAGRELDFFVLCSSLSSLRPIIGQVDYAAANAFMDAYALERARETTGVTVAIDWGFWQELGMIDSARLPAGVKQQIEQEIAQTIEDLGQAAPGVEAFRRILSDGTGGQILVSPRHPDDGVAPEDQVEAPAPAAHGAGRPSAPRRVEVDYPLFEACLIDRPDRRSYLLRLSGKDHWITDEHRILGKAVVPGTGYLEFARAAFQATAEAGAIELRDVVFLSPLVLEDDRATEFRVILKRRETASEFFVVSRLGEEAWQEHARGEVRALADKSAERHDLTKLAAACAHEDIVFLGASGANGASALEARLNAFGRRWKCLTRVRCGPDQALAELRLPEGCAADLEHFALHPALLDMATGFLSVKDRFEESLPFSYGSVEIRQPLPARFFCHVRYREKDPQGSLRFDVILMDPDGYELVVVRDYCLRRLPEAMIAGADGTVDGSVAGAEIDNVAAGITSPGRLDTLRFHPSPRRAPGPDEVEIEVAATGLNFIEVLYALGMLPNPTGAKVRFGLECAGRVSRLGDRVQRFEVGDEVIALAPGSMGLFTTTPVGAVVGKPSGMSPTAAATIPAAFATAYHALIELGRLREGERVLIHSAAGGVGLAAVEVARWAGAEIFATAGNTEKRDYLRSLGIACVMDSRSLDFAEEVTKATAGEGVDLILNSLGGEFITKGLSVLARRGRFLELGKRDIFADSQIGLAPFARQLSFIAVDVSPDMPGFSELWRTVIERFVQGDFASLPVTEFPMTALTEAFEYMARGKHIGKIVVTNAEAQSAETLCAGHRVQGLTLAEIIGEEQAPVAEEITPSRPGKGPRLAAMGPVAVPAVAGHQRPSLSTSYRPPQSDLEQRLVEIWQELLGVEQIGVDDNFFELNGDSLLAAQVTSRLHRQLQIKLPLSSLFDLPTVSSLAQSVEQGVARAQGAPTRALVEAEEEEGEL